MLAELCLHFGLSTDEHDFTDFFSTHRDEKERVPASGESG